MHRGASATHRGGHPCGTTGYLALCRSIHCSCCGPSEAPRTWRFGARHQLAVLAADLRPKIEPPTENARRVSRVCQPAGPAYSSPRDDAALAPRRSPAPGPTSTWRRRHHCRGRQQLTSAARENQAGANSASTSNCCAWARRLASAIRSTSSLPDRPSATGTTRTCGRSAPRPRDRGGLIHRRPGVAAAECKWFLIELDTDASTAPEGPQPKWRLVPAGSQLLMMISERGRRLPLCPRPRTQVQRTFDDLFCSEGAECSCAGGAPTRTLTLALDRTVRAECLMLLILGRGHLDTCSSYVTLQRHRRNGPCLEPPNKRPTDPHLQRQPTQVRA